MCLGSVSAAFDQGADQNNDDNNYDDLRKTDLLDQAAEKMIKRKIVKERACGSNRIKCADGNGMIRKRLQDPLVNGLR